MGDRQIINTYDQVLAGPMPRVFISYRPNDYGRGGHSAHVQVISLNENGQELVTDRNAAWYNYKRRTYYLTGPGPHHIRKQQVIAEAIAWIQERYKLSCGFRRNAWGDYVRDDVEYPRFTVGPKAGKK